MSASGPSGPLVLSSNKDTQERLDEFEILQDPTKDL